MQGKTTFILTDRDTGKVVEKREEHNMVTNAIKDIFEKFPNIGYFTGNFSMVLNGYLPMYKSLLHGLVLLGDNVPEKSDDYIMEGRYNVIATAGSTFTGTDVKRGSFNQSQSGPIENGYRFVWDFAPEKALGTIKCAGLSSIQTGNSGGDLKTGEIYSNVIDFGVGNNGNKMGVTNFNGDLIFAMNYGDGIYYFYTYNSQGGKYINIKKYSMPDPHLININTPPAGDFVASYSLNSPIYTQYIFPNCYEGKFYIFNMYNAGGDATDARLQIASLDIETREFTTIVGTYLIIPSVSAWDASQSRCAMFNGLIYIYCKSNVYVYNTSGAHLSTIKLELSSFTMFTLMNNKLYIIGKHSSTGVMCMIPLVGKQVYLPIRDYNDGFMPVEDTRVKLPYITTSYMTALYIYLRTDYLATINNLSEPLEKIDRHALQVRYELTN